MAGKHESEKDLLMSKLLPALNENPFSSSYDGPKKDIIAPVTSKTEDALSDLHNRLFAREESQSTHPFKTLNVMETMVLKHMDSVMKRFNTCSCDRCCCDVAAYALNQLEPKYIVSDSDKRKAMEDEISNKMVLDALVNAVIKVRSNPRH